MADIETTIEDNPPSLQETPFATISNSSAIPAPTANLWSVEQQSPNPYGGNTRISVTYGGLSGIIQSPVAGPSTLGSGGVGGIQNNTRTPSVMIQVHAPMTTKVVNFICEREGGLPRVPAPSKFDTNNVLLSATIGLPAAVPHPNGQSFLYSVAGQYVFGMVSPWAIGDDLPSSVLPAVGADPSAFAFPGSQFDSSLLG